MDCGCDERHSVIERLRCLWGKGAESDVEYGGVGKKRLILA